MEAGSAVLEKFGERVEVLLLNSAIELLIGK
jgi:hypothetical protein